MSTVAVLPAVSDAVTVAPTVLALAVLGVPADDAAAGCIDGQTRGGSPVAL